MTIDADLHELRILSTLIELLKDDGVDTEDVIEVLTAVRKFIDEQLSNARREASPG